MPYGVRVNSFVEAGPLGRLPHRVVDAPGIDGHITVLVGTFAGKYMVSVW
jgi:hypothetical protein